MSGIELAGLILGAIPLVIAALENYEDGLGKVKAFWKWEDQLSDAIRKLWYQYTSYELTIRVLLASITDDVELEAMLGDPSSKLWADPTIESRLRERLTTAYKPYLYTVADIESAISQIAVSLNLERSNEITKNELQAIVLANPRASPSSQSRGFQFSKRIKFTMKKQKVKRLLEQLDQSVSRLDSFNEKTEKLEPYRNNRKSHFVVPLLRIQQYASVLHTTLNRIWASSSRSRCAINLLLEQRMKRPKQKRHRTEGDAGHENGQLTKFTLSVSDAHLEWTMAEVLVVESTTEQLQSRTKVKIAVSPPSPTVSPSTRIDHLSLPEITNLKAALAGFALEGYPGFCLDHTQGKMKGIYSSTSRLNPGEQNFTTLFDILGNENRAMEQGKLTREECYNLAVTLCSSLLQLHATPWLGERWSKRDIAFEKSSITNGTILDIPAPIRHPYIAHICSTETCDNHERDSCHAAFADDSAKLLDLGIMLLEIYFNQSLESFYTNGAASMRSELSDLGVVKRWMNREKGNLSWAFQNAISHCLRCFADPNADLNNQDFRQGVIDQILLPLQDELSIWTDGPTKS